LSKTDGKGCRHWSPEETGKQVRPQELQTETLPGGEKNTISFSSCRGTTKESNNRPGRFHIISGKQRLKLKKTLKDLTTISRLPHEIKISMCKRLVELFPVNV